MRNQSIPLPGAAFPPFVAARLAGGGERAAGSRRVRTSAGGTFRACRLYRRLSQRPVPPVLFFRSILPSAQPAPRALRIHPENHAANPHDCESRFGE
jgi:hypothetical protein